MIWCPHHKSKDGFVNGMYIPACNNQEEWQTKKSNYDAMSNRCGKREYDTYNMNHDGSNKNGEGKTKSSLKLALNQKLPTALVVQQHLSQNEADALFTSCYQKTEEGN